MASRPAGYCPVTQNRFGARLPSDNVKERHARNRLAQKPYLLDPIRQAVVLKILQEVCVQRSWTLLAAHVRTNHVHVVATADSKPEHLMNAWKAFITRGLNHLMLDRPDCRRWARHGSTRYLWTRQSIAAAIHYVVEEQGVPMAVFEMPASPSPLSIAEPRP